MKTNIYVIWDSAAEVYNSPFYLLNDAVALRAAMDLRADPSTDIGRSPQDFTMFRIGTYDDQEAQIDLQTKFTVMCKFHELQLPTPQPVISDEPTEQTA